MGAGGSRRRRRRVPALRPARARALWDAREASRLQKGWPGHRAPAWQRARARSLTPTPSCATVHRSVPIRTARRVPNCWVVGLDVTHQCRMSAAAIEGLAGRGRHGTFLHSITQFYLDYHR